MSENAYENFRTIFSVNLNTVIQDQNILNSVLSALDITMNGFEVKKTSTEIIPSTGIPDVVKYFLASKAIANLSKKSLKQYRYKLSHFFTTVKKPYTDIQTNDIRIYLFNFKQERNAQDSYVDNVRVTLNTFFRWLVENDYLAKNPCAKVDKVKFQQKRREPLSTLTLENLRWNCKTVREKAIIDFLFSTGCRVSECADVLLSDIDWEHNSIIIRHGKGNKERTVCINDEAKVALREYLKTRKDDNPALWVSKKRPYNQLGPHGIERIVHKIGERIGVHTYPHKLRHTFATVGLRSGMPLDKLQILLGHTNPKTTMIYAKQDNSQLLIEHQRAFG